MNRDLYFLSHIRQKLVSKRNSNLFIVYFNYSSQYPDLPKLAILKEFPIYNNSYINEANILMESCKLHQNIAQFYYFLVHEGKLMIFMEYCAKGNLANQILRYRNKRKKCGTLKLVDNFIQIAGALCTLHDNNIVHRDIKPENIFVTSLNEFKIGDFGLSKHMKINTQENTLVGTTIYMSPNLKRFYSQGLIKTNKINPKKEDVWSLGKTFYEMATFNLYDILVDNEEEMMRKVKGLLEIKNNHVMLIELILKMLRFDDDLRPSMREIYEKLNIIRAKLFNLENRNRQNLIEIEREVVIHDCGAKCDRIAVVSFYRTLKEIGVDEFNFDCMYCEGRLSGKEVRHILNIIQ